MFADTQTMPWEPGDREEQLDAVLADYLRVRAGQAPARTYDRGFVRQRGSDRTLHAQQPHEVVVQRKLAGTLSHIAILQDLESALITSTEALALYERFAAYQPDDLDLAAGWALALANRGSWLIAAGRLDEARDVLLDAAIRQQQLVERHPGSEGLESELAATLHNLGVLFDRLEQPHAALCCYQRAHALRAALVHARPNDNRRLADRAAMEHHVGLALRQIGLRPEAGAAFQSALDTRRQIAAAEPLVTRYQCDLAGSLSNLGAWHNTSGNRKQGLACFEQVRRIHERLVELDPGAASLRRLLAEAWFNIGVTHGAVQRRAEEGEAFRKARELQEPLVRAHPQNVEYRNDLGRTLNNLGINLWVRKLDREARQVLRQAIASSWLLVQQAPGVLAYRKLLNAHHGVLAEIEWRLGNAAASVEQVLARQALWKDEPWELFRAGGELARAATIAREEEQKRYRALAMRALRQAVACGFRDVRKLREDPDLALLRPQVEFQALLTELTATSSRE